ncbi:MAG: 2-oxoacid:ferredoxin oxidoreductase subunit beta [Methanobrevibacter sp.]|jgi:2-oxoglutarate ferredoxin oxidoreductase subunit beta|nr:2-oxoacid:ferredoxin oxidoreductase subunit beta [Candidatus Methanovirga meridionalis]
MAEKNKQDFITDEEKNPYIKYFRKDRLPTIFCSGCGIGITINSFLKGLESADIDFNNLSLVSGIGCSSRVPGYLNCDSLHTTHGRAMSFATGLKIGNPDLNVVVFTGDGDASAIGGNHLIHAARRNINLTVICINNNIYGMTGGQVSPTSPEGTLATTAPYGSIDTPFNLIDLVTAAGASFVGRWTTAHPLQLSKTIKNGLLNNGFSFIEVVSQCPTYYGRKNKLKTPVSMIKMFKENSINKRRADTLSEEELLGKIVVGEFVNKKRGELSKKIDDLSYIKSGRNTIRKSAYIF